MISKLSLLLHIKVSLQTTLNLEEILELEFQLIVLQR